MSSWRVRETLVEVESLDEVINQRSFFFFPRWILILTVCLGRANNHNKKEIFLSLLTCGVLIGSHTITEQKFCTKMTYASLSEVSLLPVGKSSHTQGLPAAYCNGHQGWCCFSACHTS